MKKKLVLLAALAVSSLLSGCYVTINGSRSAFSGFFWGAVIFGIGFWNYCDPEAAFHFGTGWKYEGLEPSERGLDARRWGGLLGMVIGILLLFNSCMA